MLWMSVLAISIKLEVGEGEQKKRKSLRGESGKGSSLQRGIKQEGRDGEG